MKNLYPVLLFGALLISCDSPQLKSELEKFKAKEATETSNIAAVKSLFAALDSKDSVTMATLIHPEFVANFGSSEEGVAMEVIRPLIASIYAAFPDYNHTLENVFASGEYVAAEIKYGGTHQGPYMDVRPTGNPISYKGIFIFRFKDGKIIGLHEVEDAVTMMRQIGIEVH